ncbi:hypothetical protein Nepgr_017922 [Nepenthes gracilis]|uniref:Large ribosomal subunit protein uL1c n=1 Tax=Nepenthes gracilis TaxID=150966 RepID=A0AAD3XTS9_NEPGR|nr:hypothetical protein Nepgr_017922 [Nepenthes gracilis]
MAAERLLSHVRRIPRPRSLQFTLCRVPFSSLSVESNPQSRPNEEGKRNTDTPPPIQPVSYPVKPKPSISSEEQLPPPAPTASHRAQLPRVQSPRGNLDAARALTREEIRFVKDFPVISPVSYPKKVAPLPEDRVATEGEGQDEGKGWGGEIGELDRERKRIESDYRVVRKVFKVVEEEKEVPFPMLIKVEKKQSEKKVYDLQDAIRQVKANAKRNFNETVEAHVNLGIDRRRSDLGVSGAVVLPHGTGKDVRVAVFAEGAAADEARAAGAYIVGGDELIREIKNGGKINFDKCIATHSMMQRVASISKILRGLTPNTKKGTVTNDIAVAVKEAKQGLLDFKMKDSIVHVGLGKVSFLEDSLRENIGAFVNALLLAKPPGLKKTSKYAGYVNSFHLCSTMGPGFPVSIQSLSRAADLYTKLHPQR